MEKIVEQTLLYDFYGELLTPHQREIYEDVVFHDLSLSEAAEEKGISRQGVHDLIRRCDKSLNEYEEKLHLIRRFADVRASVEDLHRIVMEYVETKRDDLVPQMDELYRKIIENI